MNISLLHKDSVVSPILYGPVSNSYQHCFHIPPMWPFHHRSCELLYTTCIKTDINIPGFKAFLHM